MFPKKKYVVKFCKKKMFKTRGGCWKHEQKCLLTYKMRTKKQKEIDRLKDKRMEWKRVAEEATKNAEEATKQVEEVMKLNKILKETTKTIQTNIGTQNNTINVNLFLNEYCKNAIPIFDFVRSLQFTLNDIDPMRPISSVESLSNAIVKQLNELEDTKKPVYCSDAKRLKFYVKDASGWIKDDDNTKIDKAIGFANTRHQGAWHEHAKNEGLDKAKKDDYYLNMNIAMGEWSDDVQGYKKKIKKAIADVTNLKLSKKNIID